MNTIFPRKGNRPTNTCPSDLAPSFQVFRYGFSETTLMVSIVFKVILSLYVLEIIHIVLSTENSIETP